MSKKKFYVPLIAAMTAMFTLAMVGVAWADQITADGDSLTVTGSPNPSVTDCTVPHDFNGSAKIDFQGGSHFAGGAILTVTVTADAGISASGPASVTLPATWTMGSTHTFTGVDTSVPAGVTQGTYKVTVALSGAKAGGGTLAIDDFFNVNVECAPTVLTTTPANNAVDVAINSDITVTFSEPVNVAGTWFTIACPTSHTATVTGGPTTFTLNPDTDFGYSETCTATILAANVTDQDGNDPPDNMAANYVFSFETEEPVVTNAAPTVNGPIISPEPSEEGESVQASATFTDDGFGGGPIMCTVDYDDGGVPVAGTVTGDDTSGTCTGPSHTYVDDDDDVCSGGECNVAVTVDDGDLSGSNSSIHVVDNVEPTITSLGAGSNATCGTANSLTINFTDPAFANDTYSASIDWGNSDTSSPTGISSGDSFPHTYSTAGGHTVTVTVSDEDGGTSASMQTTLFVNYNSSGILQPVNWTQAQNDPSIFKWGSTIPVKVQFFDCDGSNAGSGLAVKIKVTWVSGNTPPAGDEEVTNTNSPDSGQYMRWADPQYMYNLNSKSLSDKTAMYHITLTVESTGQTVETDFGTKAK